MDSADKIIEEFTAWFEGEGFRPQASYAKERELTRDLCKQLDSWVQQKFAGWQAKAKRVPKYRGAFGYGYRPDIELFHGNDECIPIEVKLMKDGWEPNQAVGQAIMYCSALDQPKAIAAVLDVRRDSPAYGWLERELQKNLWVKLRVRLCVKKL